MRLTRTVLFSFPVLSLLLIAAVLPFASGVLPTVRFTSERIEVHVYPDEIRVKGQYFYKNPFPFPVQQGFTIPFPIDKDHPEPMEVHVERRTPVTGRYKAAALFWKHGF